MARPILLTTDFSDLSEAAVGWGRELAQRFAAPLHCLHVVDDSPYLWVGGPKPTAADLVAAAKANMKAFRERQLAGLDQPVVTHVAVGKPFVEIVRYAREKEAALIVMASHGRTGLSYALVGSTTETVVRNAPCPVLVIRRPDFRFRMP